MIMVFDIIKLIILGTNSAYFLCMGSADKNLIYVGIGVVSFFVMIGIVGFTSGYESLWTFLLTFIVTIPCNIVAAEMMSFDMIYEKYSDSYPMMNVAYEAGYTHKTLWLVFSHLSVWQKTFTIVTIILICMILLTTEIFASGLIAQLIWPVQKNDVFDEPVPTEETECKGEQETDIRMRLTWSRKNNIFYTSDFAIEDEQTEEERTEDEKVEQEVDWRELMVEGDKPVGVIRFRNRSRNSDGSDSALR